MSDILLYPIARDVRVQINFTGRVTQEAVQKLIDLLAEECDTFPTNAEVEAERRSGLESLARVALETAAGQSPCVHCSYTGERKYKMCDLCLASWLEANRYDPSGNRITS